MVQRLAAAPTNRTPKRCTNTHDRLPKAALDTWPLQVSVPLQPDLQRDDTIELVTWLALTGANGKTYRH
jgi:hypothetical protein